MARRRPDPEDQHLWARVAATIRPLDGKVAPPISAVSNTRKSASAKPAPAKILIPRASGSAPGVSLDSTWDRRLSKGLAAPDRTIDLHGDTQAGAHLRLNQALAEAVAHERRLILVITGKPARDNPRLPPTRRGVIRASIHDWLAASPHAGRIAAIRNAHPRHGGDGALYIVMKRRRPV